MKKYLLFIVLIALLVAGCSSKADTASQNLSTAADNFEITRRIVFYNGITDTNILVIEGRCALGNFDPSGELSVTCKTGEDSYKKHFLGLSDNVTYFAEQIDAAPADPWRYRVIFAPASVVPDVDLQVP